MEFNEFNNRWRNAFGYCLTERQGSEQWRAFLESDLCNDAVVAMLLKQYSERYNQLMDEESPHAKDRIPTLDAFKAKYFAVIRERNAAVSKPSGCSTCGGDGHVFGLAPCSDDSGREKAPEDFMTVDLKRVYWGVEAYPCPTCQHKVYENREPLRQRVMANTMPGIVRKGEHGNPYGWTVGGDLIIRCVLEARLSQEWMPEEEAAAPAEVAPEGDCCMSLEEAFPLDDVAGMA